MSAVTVGSVLTPDYVPRGAVAPLTVAYVGHQAEGPYYQGAWANGVPGVVFPEDLTE